MAKTRSRTRKGNSRTHGDGAAASGRGAAGSAGAGSTRAPVRAQLLDWLSKAGATSRAGPGSTAVVPVRFCMTYDAAEGENVFLLGSATQLGAWDPNAAVAMQQPAPGQWQAAVALEAGAEVSYKYVVRGVADTTTDTSRGSHETPAETTEAGVERVLGLSKKKMATMPTTIVVDDTWQFPACDSASMARNSGRKSLKETVARHVTGVSTTRAVDAGQWELRCLRAEKALCEAVSSRDAFVKCKVAQSTQDLRDENSALRRRVGSLQEAAQISRHEADKANSELGKTRASMERVTMALEGRCDDMARQIASLKAANKGLQKQASAAAAKAAEASTCHDNAMRAHKAQLDRDTLELATAADARHLALQEQLTAARAEHASTLEQLKSAHAAEVARLAGDMAQAKNGQKKSDDALDRATQALTSNLSTISRLDARCEELAQQLDNQRSTHDEAMTAATQEQAALSDKLARALDDARCAHEALQEAADERNRVQTALDAATAQAAGTAAQLAEVSATCKDQVQRLEAKQQLVLQLRSHVSDLEAQLADMANKRAQEAAGHAEQLAMALDEACTTTRDLRVAKREAVERYNQVNDDCRHWFNQAMTLKGNIRVFCRVRPQTEAEAATAAAVEVHGTRGLAVRAGGREVKKFAFDHVFDNTATQQRVFKEVAPLVTSALDGYNVCVFAYGQTGSGKTHTMMGTPEQPGVFPRTVHKLFQQAQTRRHLWKYTFAISVLEVYNETVRDLLTTRKRRHADAKLLDVKVSKRGKVELPGLVQVTIRAAADVERVVATAHGNRAVAKTEMNAHSSRSHMVMRISCAATNAVSGDTTTAVMHLVDLAGSERLSRSQATGSALKETQHINKSLSALGDVVHALQSKAKHVPYRNSKLTYLLQDALGGNAKTLMMCQVSPCQASARESTCTLQFARRAASVHFADTKATASSGDSKRLSVAKDRLKSLSAALETAQQDLGATKQALSEAQATAAASRAQAEASQAQLLAAEGMQAQLTQQLLAAQQEARSAAQSKHAAVEAAATSDARCKEMHDAKAAAEARAEAAEARAEAAATASSRAHESVAALRLKLERAEATLCELAAQAAKAQEEQTAPTVVDMAPTVADQSDTGERVATVVQVDEADATQPQPGSNSPRSKENNAAITVTSTNVTKCAARPGKTAAATGTSIKPRNTVTTPRRTPRLHSSPLPGSPAGSTQGRRTSAEARRVVSRRRIVRKSPASGRPLPLAGSAASKRVRRVSASVGQHEGTPPRAVAARPVSARERRTSTGRTSVGTGRVAHRAVARRRSKTTASSDSLKPKWV